MRVDEKLARGLEKDFWRWLDSQEDLMEKQIPEAISQLPPVFPNLKYIQAGLIMLDEAIHDIPGVLDKGVAGTKMNSAWWCLALGTEHEHEFKGREEKALRFDVLKYFFSASSYQPSYLTLTLAGHCIARLFERLSWQELPTPESILPEFKELADLFYFYVQLSEGVEKHEILSLRPPVFIPTKNGVFLGIQNPDDWEMAEVRTFIGNSMLSARQAEFANQLRAIHSRPAIQEMNAMRIVNKSPGKATMIKYAEALSEAAALMQQSAAVMASGFYEQYPHLIEELGV